MPALIPLALQVKNIVSCYVYGGAVGTGSAGAAPIVWATGVDISTNGGTGTFSAFEITPRQSSTDYGGADGIGEANLSDKNSFSFSIEEIANAGTGSTLENIGANFDYIKVVCLYRARGATTGGFYRAAIGHINETTLPLSGSGPQRVRISADQASPNVFPYVGATLPTVYTT